MYRKTNSKRCPRKNNGWSRKKRKPETRRKRIKQLEVKQVSLVDAASCADGESISIKREEDTLEVKWLPNACLSTSERRSKRACVTGDTSNQCKICHLGFSTEYNLRKHLDYYGDPRYPCNECGVKFTDKRQLQSHVSNAHRQPNPRFTVKCVLCKQMFAQPAHLRAHLSHYHEDWKESIKTEEEPAECSSAFTTVVTEIPDFLKTDVNCVEDSKKKAISECQTTSEVHLQTQDNAENDFFTNTVENFTTSLATVSPNRLEDNENKSDERLREKKQTVSRDVQDTDVLRNRLECNNENEDTTVKQEHAKGVNGENTDGLNESKNQSNQIMEGNESVLFLNGETNPILESPLNDKSDTTMTGNDLTVRVKGEKECKFQSLDNENECNQIMRENEQMLHLNRENTEVLESRPEDNSNTTTKGDARIVRVKEEKEYDFQSQCLNNEDKSDEWSRENENVIPVSEEYSRSQTVQINSAELEKSIDEYIQPCAVPIKDEVLSSDITADMSKEKNTKTDTIRDSEHCIETNHFHTIEESAKSPVNITLLDARSGMDKITATSIDIQEKTQKSNSEKSLYQVRDYENEVKLRRLHSCKDCYVPLMRVKVSDMCSQSANAILEVKQTLDKPPYTVIPSVVCNTTFASKVSMYRHYHKYHLTYLNNRLHCVCGKSMNGFEALDFHFYRYCEKTVSSDIPAKRSDFPCVPLEKKIECMGCGEKFWLKSCLRSHAFSCRSFIKQKVRKILPKISYVRSGSRKYCCRVCNILFGSEESKLKHESTFLQPATSRCFRCGTMFVGNVQLKCHMATAHTLKNKTGFNFKCTVCNQRFKQERNLHIHRMHVHQSQVFLENIPEPMAGNLSPPDSDDDEEESINKCSVCNIVFSSEKRFIDHVIYYRKSEIIHCKTCGEEFEGQYRAHQHNKAVHYSEDARISFTHNCNVCKEGFMYMTHLQAHIFHVHVDAARTTTLDDQNGRSKTETHENSSRPEDSLLYQLEDREVTAVPGIEYECTICDLRFPTQTLLAVHEMDFANDGEYLCNRCSRKCRTPATLLDHLTLNHSNNALQNGVKCRRCNENFQTHRAWIAHVKHVHSNAEPSEFYFEKNVASTETSGDLRYQLIPTNQSISNGVTYFEVLSSIHAPELSETRDRRSDNDDEADRKDCNADLNRISAVITKKEPLEDVSHEKSEKRSLNVDTHKIKVENVEEDVPMIDYFDDITDNKSLIDTSTINAALPREEPSTTIKSEQAANTNLEKDESRNKMENSAKKKAMPKCFKTRKAVGRVSGQGWNCKICDYAFRCQADLSRHMSLYSDSGCYMCEICGRRFETHEFYQGHQSSHNERQNNKYSCSTCNEGFLLYQSVKMHIAHLHTPSLQKLPSDVSDKRLAPKRQADLSRHVSPDPDSGYYMCEICGRRFKTHEFSQGHQSSHNERQNNEFSCSSCNEGLLLKQSVKMENANLHPQSLQKLPSGVSDKRFVPERQELQLPESLQPSRARVRRQRLPEPSSYRLVLPSSVKKLGSHVRTEVTESPRLHTEIFEDEISLTYECPNCQEKYSTVEQLDEHLTVVHGCNRDKTGPEESSNRSHAHMASDEYDKVFANKSLSNTHKEQPCLMKSLQVVRRSAAPVMEITAQTDGPKDPSTSEKPRVIGRLYKLEEMNIIPNPEHHDKNQIKKKFTVTRIFGTNAEQKNHFSTTSIQTKGNPAVQLKMPNAKVVQLNTLPKTVLQKPPIIKVVPLKQPLNSTVPKAVLQKPPVIKVVPLKQPLNSTVPKAVLLKSTDSQAVQLKPPVLKTVRMKVPIPKAMQLKASVPKASQLKPPVVNSVQTKPHVINAVQAIPLDPNAVQVKPSATDAAQIIPPVKNTKQVTPIIPKGVKLKPLFTNAAQVKPLFTKAVQVKPLLTNAVQVKPFVATAVQVKPESIDLASRSLLKRVMTGNCKPIALSPSALMKRMKIVKVESCSSDARTATSTTASTVESKSVTSTTNTVASSAVSTVASSAVNTEASSAVNTVASSAVNTVTSTAPISIASTVASTTESSTASSVASTVHAKYECQFRCTDCNVYLSGRRLTEHRKNVHSSSSSNDKTVHEKYPCQFRCTDCNVYLSGRRLTEHRKNVHSSSSSNDKTVDNSDTVCNSTKSSMDQLRQLVSSLPPQPENENDKEAQMPFCSDFESVLIQVSSDVSDDFLDESSNTEKSETQIDPLNLLSEDISLADNDHKAVPLKVRSFARIANNSERRNVHKRKDKESIDTPATKRPRSVFDPSAYEELCRQHKLNPVPYWVRPMKELYGPRSSTIFDHQSKTVTES